MTARSSKPAPPSRVSYKMPFKKLWARPVTTPPSGRKNLRPKTSQSLLKNQSPLGGGGGVAARLSRGMFVTPIESVATISSKRTKASTYYSPQLVKILRQQFFVSISRFSL